MDVFNLRLEFRTQRIIHHKNKIYNNKNNLLINLSIKEQIIFKNLIDLFKIKIIKMYKAQDKFI
jgi:hypothetical protein